MGFFQWLGSYAGSPKTVQVPDGPPAPLARRRFRFSGFVQGVGFRYEAQGLASQLGLVGWVQNQRDGSVIVELEGAANYIDAFLLAIHRVPRFDITDTEAENLPPVNNETSFKILY